MRQKATTEPNEEYSAWFLDQIAKSEFFHQQLHNWGMLEVAEAIEAVKGERLKWNRKKLAISGGAWERVVHRGIKPVVVFAHPSVLRNIARSTAYYRMLSMVSQKSMIRTGLPTTTYERGTTPTPEVASRIASHLNSIISRLVEQDEEINAREFDLWRGMAAGTQAQGSWQNIKGERAEVVVKGVLKRRLRERELVKDSDEGDTRITLNDGRIVTFGDEPDVAVHRRDRIIAAVEVKGGIDAAGVLERVGAAVKSLSRAKEENPASVTLLLLQGVSLTDRAREDLDTNRQSVNCWFTIEGFLKEESTRDEVFELLGI